MKVFTQKSTEQSVSLKVDIYDNMIVVVSGKFQFEKKKKCSFR